MWEWGTLTRKQWAGGLAAGGSERHRRQEGARADVCTAASEDGTTSAVGSPERGVQLRIGKRPRKASTKDVSLSKYRVHSNTEKKFLGMSSIPVEDESPMSLYSAAAWQV